MDEADASPQTVSDPAPPSPRWPQPRHPGAPPPGRPAPHARRSLKDELFEEPFAFDFFQAVRLLQAIDPSRVPVGRGGPPSAEVVRFRAHISLGFPPSAIHDITPADDGGPPELIQAFLGLTGPNGVLPRHYTELLHRLERREKGPERHVLRDWLDLFNHRFTALFFRAWEKYRFAIPYERKEYERDEPDPFTRALLSLVGLGLPALRDRLIVAAPPRSEDPRGRGRVLARIEDLTLLYYSGLFAHRPRNATSLEALVGDYFGARAAVQQFRGQWLLLEPENRTALGDGPWANNQLGVSAVAGDRVWSVRDKFRVRLGPLGYARFLEFLPDRAPEPRRKAYFLLVHLVRLYVGPQLDFDVQVVLKADEVPECRLGGPPPEARLGWNTWLLSQPLGRDADDAVFEGSDVPPMIEVSAGGDGQ